MALPVSNPTGHGASCSSKSSTRNIIEPDLTFRRVLGDTLLTLKLNPLLRGATLATLTVVLLAACASGGSGGKRGGGPGGSRGGGPGGESAQMTERGGGFGNVDFNALYRRTLEEKAGGECQKTLAPLKTLAHQGPGYEGAQQALGECLLQNAAPEATTDQVDALVWLRRAAEGGRTEAQGALAAVYLDGPEALRNRDQALFWYALYKDNASRGRVAFVALAPATEARLKAAFADADLASVATDIANWQPTVWIPPKDSAFSGPGGDGQRSDERRQRR